MADNPFDQFDGAVAPDTPTQKATAPDATAAQPTSSTALAQPAANPFDQFDAARPALHHYRVKAPNGHTYEFDAPADTPPEQLDALSRKAAGYGDKYPVTTPKHDGLGEQLIDATKNDVAGIAQGAAALPDIAAQAVGKVMSVVPNAIGEGLRAAGHHDAADWIQANLTNPLANPATIGGMIEEASPTSNAPGGHAARFVSNLAGGAAAVPASVVESAAAKLVGEAPKMPIPVAVVPKATSSYVKLARDLKIRRTPATNSGTGVSTVIQSGLAALPGGAPIAAAASRETGDLSAAAKGVAEDLGQVSDRQGAGEAIAQGAQSYKASSRLTANDMYGQRDALIGGPEAPVPTDNAKAALDNIAARFPTSPAIAQLREHPAIRAIGGALPGEPTVENVPTGLLDANGQPMTRAVTSGGQPLALGEVTEALSHVRGVVRNLESQTANGKATAPVLARAKQVEQGLEDDVMAAAQKADIAAGRTPGAEGSAVRAQRDADAFYADRASALNGSLKKALKSAADDTQMSGEAVYNQVANDMDAKAGNLARLRDTWFRLPPAAKSTFAATRIDDLGRAMPGQQNDAGSAWSFNTFLTNLNKMSPQARNIVFGTKADADLQKIAAYADRLKQLDRARNFSNTAQKYFAGAFMAAVGGAVLHGDIGGAAEAAMAIPVTWGGAKLLLATPAMRDWTAQAMRALTTNNGTAMKVLTRQLGTIASTHPAIANQVSGLQKAITNAANDNLHSLAASGSQQNPDGEPKKANGTR